MERERVLLLISTLTASAMGFRKLVGVVAQDWAREVFPPAPIQALWVLHFTPDGANILAGFLLTDDGFFRLLLNPFPSSSLAFQRQLVLVSLRCSSRKQTLKCCMKTVYFTDHHINANPLSPVQVHRSTGPWTPLL